ALARRAAARDRRRPPGPAPPRSARGRRARRDLRMVRARAQLEGRVAPDRPLRAARRAPARDARDLPRLRGRHPDLARATDRRRGPGRVSVGSSPSGDARVDWPIRLDDDEKTSDASPEEVPGLATAIACCVGVAGVTVACFYAYHALGAGAAGAMG